LPRFLAHVANMIPEVWCTNTLKSKPVDTSYFKRKSKQTTGGQTYQDRQSPLLGLAYHSTYSERAVWLTRKPYAIISLIHNVQAPWGCTIFVDGIETANMTSSLPTTRYRINEPDAASFGISVPRQQVFDWLDHLGVCCRPIYSQAGCYAQSWQRADLMTFLLHIPIKH
jgi:hypothetical protein